MFRLDQEVIVCDRVTTICKDLAGDNRQSLMLFKFENAPKSEKYSVIFSKLPRGTSDTKAFEISKADFKYLQEQGVRNAFE